jgi:hypothetical protein
MSVDRGGLPSVSHNTHALLRTIRAAIPILFLLLLDSTFDLYFWRIPKLTDRSTDYGYQFLFDTHRLEQPKPAGSLRIVAFGSSTSIGFEPYQIQDLLTVANPTASITVHRLLKPGMKPSDYRIFFEAERPRIQPDIVVLPFTVQDFLNPSFERNLKPDVQYVLPPWATLRERYAHIPTVSEKLDLALASVSNLYRYRRPIRSCVQDHIKTLLAWLRSSSGNSGYGCYPDGYAKQRFGIPIDHASTLDLKYYVHPEWIRQRGKVGLVFSAGGHILAERTETSPGWKAVHLQLPASAARVLEVAADSPWSPRAAGVVDDPRQLGLQLRECSLHSLANEGHAPYRYPPVDERQISTYLDPTTGEEFLRRWEAGLRANNNRGIRLRAWLQEKIERRDQAFEPAGEYAEMERLVAAFSHHGTRVILINAPESSLVADYQNGSYYRGYLQFFRDLAAKYPGVQFHNLVKTLAPEDFNDSVHVNFVGGIKLGLVFANILQQTVHDLSQARNEQPAQNALTGPR